MSLMNMEYQIIKNASVKMQNMLGEMEQHLYIIEGTEKNISSTENEELLKVIEKQINDLKSSLTKLSLPEKKQFTDNKIVGECEKALIDNWGFNDFEIVSKVPKKLMSEIIKDFEFCTEMQGIDVKDKKHWSITVMKNKLDETTFYPVLIEYNGLAQLQYYEYQDDVETKSKKREIMFAEKAKEQIRRDVSIVGVFPLK